MDDFLGTGGHPWGFQPCWGSTGVIPDDACAIHDIDQDGVIGPTDYESLLLAWDDPLDDCDEDGQLDLLELLQGTQVDEDGDGIPDDCQLCPSDINGDDQVGVDDLLVVIADWGPCTGCDGDLNNDTMVDVNDLLAIIAAWGPCESGP